MLVAEPPPLAMPAARKPEIAGEHHQQMRLAGTALHEQRLRSVAAHGGGEAFRVCEVTGEAGRAVVVEGHELTQRSEAALEFPADLAVLAEEKDFHGK